MRLTLGRCIAALVVSACLVVPPANAQDGKALAELKTWTERLSQPGEVLSPQDGRRLRDKAIAWDLPPEKLSKDQLADLSYVQVIAALAIGDAAQAAAELKNLRGFSEGRQTLRAAWLVAGAAGDAALARQTLDKLKADEASKPAAIEMRMKRLETVGKPAPQGEAQSTGGTKVAFRDRNGAALVILFVKTADLANEKTVKSLRDLYTPVANEKTVQFASVCSDSRGDPAALHKALLNATCPSDVLVGKDLPRLFNVEGGPAAVLVDPTGNIRAVATPSDPELVYAVRASVAEAKGEFAAILPKTTTGTVATPVAGPSSGNTGALGGQKTAAAPGGNQPGGQGGAVTPQSELPHNAEAASMIRQARVFLKTGRRSDAKRILKEVVEKYPGTYEAREAQSDLEILGA